MSATGSAVTASSLQVLAVRLVDIATRLVVMYDSGQLVAVRLVAAYDSGQVAAVSLVDVYDPGYGSPQPVVISTTSPSAST